MGVKKKFAALVKKICGAQQKISNNIDLKGKVFALDVSILLHQFLPLATVYPDYIMEPPIPLPGVVSQVISFIKTLHAWDIRVIVVFDGARNPFKLSTNEKRLSAIETSKVRMEEMRKKPVLKKDMKEYVRVCKAAAGNVREDILADLMKELKSLKIPFLIAPVEAEVQCVELEQQGVVNGTLSTDMDTVVQGGRLVIVISNWRSPQGLCYVVDKNVILPALSKHYLKDSGAVLTQKDLAIIAFLLGCDYSPGYMSDAQAQKWIMTFKGNETSAIELFCKERKYDVTESTAFQQNFNAVVNHILNHPVFRFVEGTKQKFDYADVCRFCFGETSDELTVELGTHIPSTLSLEIRCGYNVLESLKKGWKKQDDSRSVLELADIFFKGDLYIRTGDPCLALPFPKFAGGDVMHGSMIDWDKMSPDNVVKFSVNHARRFLNHRGIITGAHSDEYTLMKLKEVIKNPEMWPIKDRFLRDGELGFDQDCIQRGDKAHEWKTDDSMLVVLRNREMVTLISDAYIDEVFGKLKNGIRYRASIILQGGHFTNCKITKGDMIQEGSGDVLPCYIVSLECCPSMKRGVYTVYLVFAENGKFQPFPASRCKCPDGHFFCSHMLGALMLISIFQAHTDHTDLNYAELLAALPPPIATFFSLPVYLRYYIPWD